ncbi:MAG: ABC transporter ATP-binding protein [Mycoplasmoidaceae bacterium]
MSRASKIIKQNQKNIRLFGKTFKTLYLSKQNTKSGISHYRILKDPKPILFVENLYKRYPRKKSPAINNITFNVYPGQFHAFIGANGAGKTTAIKSIIGAYARWSGTVLIDGKKNTSIDAKRSLGYIPENARFPQRMSCYSYLVWMAKLSGLSGYEAKRFAKTRLTELNMWNLRGKSPNTFSSGQKKKVLLAQALINNPQVLVMDEPAANLDPKARLELFDTLGKLTKEGKAIFISSHVLAELDRYANAATILDGGKIVFTGTTKQLYDKYADRKLSVSVSNPSKLKTFLKERGIDYRIDDISQNFIINFQTKKQEMDFLQLVQKKNIQLLSFNEIGNKLDDIYKKLIKFGSVDTMERK